jgi:hypothetical protein
MILFTEYGELDVSESPVLVLECGHIKTVETMDGLLVLTSFILETSVLWNGPQSYPSCLLTWSMFLSAQTVGLLLCLFADMVGFLNEHYSTVPRNFSFYAPIR